MLNNTNAPVEIERKYIIKMPSREILSGQNGYTKSEILQIYLPSEKGETHRIRRRAYGEKTLYFETRKQRIDKMSSHEDEREISAETFYELAEKPLEGTAPIEKLRHTFVYLGQLFEIDVYPQWKNTAVMETELDTREGEVEIPAFVEIIREVTGDKAYSNASMSKSFPPEDIF